MSERKHKWEGFNNAAGYFRICKTCKRVVSYPELPEDGCLGETLEAVAHPKGRTWKDRCKDEARYNR